MATRYFCDRCKKEVSTSAGLAGIDVDDGATFVARKEICASCINDLRRFFDGLSLVSLQATNDRNPNS